MEHFKKSVKSVGRGGIIVRQHVRFVRFTQREN